MNLKASAIGSVFLLAVVGGAHGQPAPSVAAAWGESKGSQADCLERGLAVFKRLNFKRVEANVSSVYGDFENMQLGIRCVPDKQMYFVFGGRPGEDERPLLTQINRVKAEMDRN